MSGDSESLQLVNPDKEDLDSSDDVIELDSEDAESDHEESVISAECGTDVSSLSGQDHGSKSGMDLVEDKPDAECMPPSNCLVSENSLMSKCAYIAENTDGNGSATELATGKEFSPESEHGPKDSLALSMKNDEDVPSLESQGHEPAGLDLVEDKPGAKCMTLNNCLVSVEDKSAQECSMPSNDLEVECSLGPSDVTNVPGTEDHDSTKTMTAGNQLSLSEKDNQEIIEKEQHGGSDDAKSMSSNVKKKAESRWDKDNSKKRSQSRDRIGNDGKSRRSQSCDKKGSDTKNRRSQSCDKKGSNTKSRRSQSRDEKGSDTKSRRSQSRDKKGSDTKSRRSQSCDKKGSNTKSRRSQSHDKKGSDTKSRRSQSHDKKGSDSKSRRSQSRDKKGSDTKSRRSQSHDKKGSDTKSRRSQSRDRKDSGAKSRRSQSRDRKGSVDKGRRSESHGKKDGDKSGRSQSDDKNGSGDKSGRSLSHDKKGSGDKCVDKRGDTSVHKSGNKSGDKSGDKNGSSNRSPGKKDGDNSRTKRNRSGSRPYKDDVRKRRRVSKSRSRSRRRVSKSRSRSRRRDRLSRTPDYFDSEREKTRQVSDILQSKIDRLKEEVEKAKAELKQNSRPSQSTDRLHSDLDDGSIRTFDELGNPIHYRSRSRSSNRLESFDSISRRSHLPSVQRFLDASHGSAGSSPAEDKQVVVVKNVNVKDENVRSEMLTKFKRYGSVVHSVFDMTNHAAILHYKSLASAQEAVKSMNNRYFEGEYLMAVLVNERDVELAIAAGCSECGKGHSPSECPKLKKSRRNSRSRARSSSLGLHWPAKPRHPSTNLFNQKRGLSPLSCLMATEALRDGGNRPVLFRPKPMATSLVKISAELSLGPERLARREMTMKKMNGIVKCDWGERSLSDFEVLATVGKGTYGQMYKAADKDMKLLMALKKVTVESDKSGFPISALQEMKLLSRLDHPNIVKLVEILRVDQENVVGAKITGTFYFVYDYMNHDLKRLLQSKLLQLKSEDVAWFIKQLLSALSYCHRYGLVHRDVRPSNILINNRGELKLAQFGLACLYDEKGEAPSSSSSLASTEQRMVSLWYRAPELLLGEKKSSPATDVWSCGCVIGEIFSRKPVFLGSDEQHQIEVISKVCGTPNTSNWPEVTALPLHYVVKGIDDYPRLFHDAFHYVPFMARNLLDQLLVMDPAKRLTADSALDTDWLKDADFPRMLPMMLVNINDCHMLMPAKPPINSGMHRLPPGAGKASSISLQDHKLEGFARSNFVTRTQKEDVSDRIAIACSLDRASVHESDTVWKPLRSGAGRETTGLSVADVQGSRDPAETPYPTSSQPSRRAFQPRVMDYACQPTNAKPASAFNPRVTDYACQPSTYAKPASPSKKPVLQPENRYTGSSSVHSVNIAGRTNLATEKSLRYEDLPQGMRHPGEGHTERLSSSLERPAASHSGTKQAAQASDDRTFSADLERLRMLKRKLEMVGSEKRDSRASLAKAGTVDNWEAPPARKGNLGESAAFSVGPLKHSADAGNTGSQVSFESNDRWENEPLPKRAAISGQPPAEKATGAPGADTSRGNVEASYTRAPALSRVPVTYVNQLLRSYAALSGSKPHDDLSDFGGGRGVYQQPETSPLYNRKSLPSSQANPSTAQTWDGSYPERTAEQRLEYDNRARDPGRGFSESAPYSDERWRADDRWNEATRPHPGPSSKESDVEWRAPESRF